MFYFNHSRTTTQTAYNTQAAYYVHTAIVGDTLMDFESARTWCHDQGLSMISVHSAQEDNALLNKCGNQTESVGCWLGLEYLTDSEEFVWIDGSDRDYSFRTNGNPTMGQQGWYTYQPNPNSGTSPICCQFHPLISAWKAASSCDELLYPICNGTYKSVVPTYDPTTDPTMAPSTGSVHLFFQ